MHRAHTRDSGRATVLALLTALGVVVFASAVGMGLALTPGQAGAEEPTVSTASEPPEAALLWTGERQQLAQGRQLGYFEWTGGSWDELTTRLWLHDCDLQAMWLPDLGWSWHAAAPAFVNARFESMLAMTGGQIDAGMLGVICAEADGEHRARSDWPTLDLQETEVRWLLRPEHDPARTKEGTALVQYGGGSMYHLVSRLSTLGCNVNELEIVDEETQQVYEYDYEKPNAFNQPFADKYQEFIPARTTIGVLCVDNCDIVYGLDLVADEGRRASLVNMEKCTGFDRPMALEAHQGDNLVFQSTCGDTWSEEARSFFGLVPVFQNVCKIDGTIREARGIAGTFLSIWIDGGAMYQRFLPRLFLLQLEDPAQQIGEVNLLKIELHELCHIHQDWYTFKEHIDHDYLRTREYGTARSVSELWLQTPMAQDFIDIVGFEQGANGNWRIANANNVYNNRGIYGVDDPQELSAELCAFYLTDKIVPDSEYATVARPPYITDEVREWIERYIVLPVVGSDDAG